MSKKQLAKEVLNKAGPRMKKYSPLALSCIASVGVVITAVMAVKATPKAELLIKESSRIKHDGDLHACTKKEAVAAAWKCYIPAVAIGASTIACIMGANALNMRQQAALTSAYMLIQRSYQSYKDKLKEMYGEETHNKIMDSLIKEKCRDVSISATGGWYNSTLDFGKVEEPEIIRTFHEPFSDRYFETTIAKVIEAEYHLNRNFLIGGGVSLNDFYELLGLEKTDFGETVGWSSVNGDLYWIDFNHHVVDLDDGMEIYVVDTVFEPTADWNDDL